MEHETFPHCTWCQAKLSKGSALFTSALSERGRKRPMCIKCAVWSMTGHLPPYVPIAVEATRGPQVRPLDRFRRVP